MTKEELIARDQFSNEDIKVGNVISQNDLKEESKSW